MDKVSIGNLTKEVNKLLEEYSAEIDDAVREQLPKVGKETVKELKATSPKRSGKYAKGWKSKIEKERLGDRLVVYNKVYYLTHLLENGHAKVGGGHVDGIPHIKPAQTKAEKKAIDLIKESIENVK